MALNNEVGIGVCSGKLDLNISLRLPDYFSRAAQWILVNGASFTRFSVFYDSQGGIRSLPSFVNNFRTVRKLHRCLDFPSEGSVSPLSRSLSIVAFRETAGPTSSPKLVHSFRNPLQSTWECHLLRKSDFLSGRQPILGQ